MANVVTPSRKRKHSAMSKSTKGATVSQIMMRNQETKRFRSSYTNDSGTAGYKVSVVKDLSTGSGGTNRVGNKIKVLSIDYCVFSAAVVTTTYRIRLCVYRGSGEPTIPSLFTDFLDENENWVLQDNVVSLKGSTNASADVTKMKFSYKFPSGLNLTYSGSTPLQKNVFVVITKQEGNNVIGVLNIPLNEIQLSTQISFKEI